MNKFIGVEISGEQTIINLEQIVSVIHNFRNKELSIELINGNVLKPNWKFFQKLETHLNKIGQYIAIYNDLGSKQLINVNYITNISTKKDYKVIYVHTINNKFQFSINEYDKFSKLCLE